MGVIAFVIFLVLTLNVGMGLLLASLILFIINFSKKKKGTKKSLVVRVFAWITLTLGVFALSIPVLSISLLRIGNQRTFDDYVKTDTMLNLSWADMAAGFTLDGYEYVGTDFLDSSTANENRSEAVANIKHRDPGFLNVFFGKLLNYNDIDTIYTVKNDSGYLLLSCRGSVYCKASELENIKQYYETLEDFKYSYDSLDDGDYSEIEIDFSYEMMMKLLDIYDRMGDSGSATIAGDYDVYTINANSKDSLFTKMRGMLCFREEKIFLISTYFYDNKEFTYNGCWLDEESSKYIISKINP